MEYPLPRDLYKNADTFGNCRWCGVSISDRRKRYCSEEHRDNWLNETYFVEDFKVQRGVALQRDGYMCKGCGMTRDEHYSEYWTDLHAHHVIPRSQNGSNNAENLVALCKFCHIEIHRKLGVKE